MWKIAKLSLLVILLGCGTLRAQHYIGVRGGLLLGVALALAQQHFGFLKLSGETFLIDAYPVEVHPSDLAWVIVTFVSVSYLISVLTVRAMIPKKEISQNRP